MFKNQNVMAFKFKTRYFVYDDDGYYHMCDNYGDAFRTAFIRSASTGSCTYVLTTSTSRIERFFFNKDSFDIEVSVLSFTNPNLEIL